MSPKDGMPTIHPGEMLLDELEYLEISPKQFAQTLTIPLGKLQAFLNGERDFDAEFALRLEHYFGSGARMWMNLQSTYSLKVAELDRSERIEREVKPRVEAPVEVAEVA